MPAPFRSRSYTPVKEASQDDDAALAAMFRHPGFLIRRAQQIAVNSFLENYGALGITPTQSTVLKLIRHRPGLDQVGVGRILGLDRTTSATVVNSLAANKLLVRRDDPADRRRKRLYIAPAGGRLLEKVGDTDESRSALLSVFTDEEAETFLALLEKFVGALNASTRIPMEAIPDVTSSTAPRRRVKRAI
jgi:DNA-binding MarR family transcriptional regulator